MKLGMLWASEKKKTLAENVALACQYYLDKYGDHPNVAYVNPADVDASTPLVRIVPRREINRGNVWIGLEGNDEPLRLRKTES